MIMRYGYIKFSPVESLPEWSRAVERRRRDLGVSTSGLSVMAGERAHWWYVACQEPEPPEEWEDRERRLNDAMDRLEKYWQSAAARLTDAQDGV